MAKTKEMMGCVFGKWTVLYRDEYCSSKNTHWICRCECGTEKSIDGTHLRKQHSRSCRRCSNHKDKGILCSRVWFRIKRNAKVRGLEVDLGGTHQEARVFLYDLLYKSQHGICALSGLPIVMATTIGGDMKGESTASLDRIDSSRGYTKDNVQWVHKLVNKMKMDLDQTLFVSLCDSIAKRMC